MRLLLLLWSFMQSTVVYPLCSSSTLSLAHCLSLALRSRQQFCAALIVRVKRNELPEVRVRVCVCVRVWERVYVCVFVSDWSLSLGVCVCLSALKPFQGQLQTHRANQLMHKASLNSLPAYNMLYLTDLIYVQICLNVIYIFIYINMGIYSWTASMFPSIFVWFLNNYLAALLDWLCILFHCLLDFKTS